MFIKIRTKNPVYKLILFSQELIGNKLISNDSDRNFVNIIRDIDQIWAGNVNMMKPGSTCVAKINLAQIETDFNLKMSTIGREFDRSVLSLFFGIKLRC